jgi:hypothetical protein
VERTFYAKLAPATRAAGLRVPQCHASVWNDPDCSRGVEVLEDLGFPAARCGEAVQPLRADASATSRHAGATQVSKKLRSAAGCSGRPNCQRLALGVTDAEAALEWLARFHAQHWRSGCNRPEQREAAQRVPDAAARLPEGPARRQDGLWEHGVVEALREVASMSSLRCLHAADCVCELDWVCIRAARLHEGLCPVFGECVRAKVAATQVATGLWTRGGRTWATSLANGSVGRTGWVLRMEVRLQDCRSWPEGSAWLNVLASCTLAWRISAAEARH